MSDVDRPVLRYHGGKWRLAPWILGFFPPHRVYVEPFGGAASVLMRKARCYAEVYNDLDGEVVNVFRVLRDPVTASQLDRLLRFTPFARREFVDAYKPCDDPVERARRTIIKSFCGFGSAAIHGRSANVGMRTRASTWPTTGFRSNSNRSGTTPAHDWQRYPEEIGGFVTRLAGVVIEEREARDVMATHDGPDTLHYVDPPYVHATRGRTHEYQHEMTDDEHRSLAAVLRAARGMVVLSGYPCELYDVDLYPDWERHERKHLADGARKRTEVVWLNAACVDALGRARLQQEAFA